MEKILNYDAIPSKRIAAIYNQRGLEGLEAEENGGSIPEIFFKPKRRKKPPVLVINNAEGRSIFSIEKDAA